MNLSPEWVESLAESGINAIHWSKLGPMNAPDAELFARARAGGWVILTQDLDFPQILFETAANGPSAVLLRLRDDLNSEARRRVAAIIVQCQSEIESGALLVIDDRKVRLRLLPLRW
jgi:predicted nuclease of predicted toxin-antitoxin system